MSLIKPLLARVSFSYPIDRPPILSCGTPSGDTTAIATTAATAAWTTDASEAGTVANVNSRTISQSTPLHHACANGFYDGVLLLLEHGASPLAVDTEGDTPADVARKFGFLECASACEAAARREMTAVRAPSEADESMTRLHVACANGDVKGVRSELESGACVNSITSTGRTPLHHAYVNGFYECVLLLLGNGASALAVNDDGDTPANVARRLGFLECAIACETAVKRQMAAARELLEVPGLPTRLHVACANGDTEGVRRELKSGACVNSITSTGRTPLHEACKHGHVACIINLLWAGADVEKTDVDGNSPLFLAVIYGHEDCVRCLLLRANISPDTIKRCFDVFTRIGCQHDACLFALEQAISREAEANEAKANEAARIARATRDAAVAPAVTSVPRDAAVAPAVTSVPRDAATAQEPASASAIHATTVAVPCVEPMRSRNAAVAKREWKAMKRRKAASRRYFVALRAALFKKACSKCLDAATWWGCTSITPLHHACYFKHMDCVSALLQAGGDVNAVTKTTGRTPLLFACQAGHVSCVVALLAAGANVEAMEKGTGITPLIRACMEGHADCVSALLLAGANMRTTMTSSGYSPLHVACKFGRDTCVELLLLAGAETEAVALNGDTPFMLAVQYGHTKCKSLIQAALDTAKIKCDPKPL